MPSTTLSRRQRSARGADGEPDLDDRTVRLARRRFARRQWARRWLAWRRVLAAAIAVGVAGAMVWLVLFSSVSAVAGVDVTGAELTGRAEVRRAAAVPAGEALATVDLAAVERRVSRLPAVASVDASRAWPDRVRVAVTERTPVAVVARGDALRGVDASGMLFRSYDTAPKRLPLVRLGEAAGAEAVAEAARVVALLPDPLAADVDHVEVDTVDTITVELRDGRTVVWGSADASETKAAVLAVLLRQKGSVYDVSVPGQPTIRR